MIRMITNRKYAIAGSSLRGNIDDVEYLEGCDKAEDGYHEGCGGKHGPGHMPEQFPGVGAIDLGRFI